MQGLDVSHQAPDAYMTFAAFLIAYLWTVMICVAQPLTRAWNHRVSV